MKKIFTSLSLFILPVFVLAAGFKTDYIDSVTTGATKIINNLVVLLIALAVVWFIYNVIKYSMSGEDEDKAKAKSQMINGIIAIAVCVSIWGLVALLQNMFLGSTGSGGAPTDLNRMIPGAQTSRSAAPAGTVFDSDGNAFAPGTR